MLLGAAICSRGKFYLLEGFIPRGFGGPRGSGVFFFSNPGLTKGNCKMGIFFERAKMSFGPKSRGGTAGKRVFRFFFVF